MRTKITESSVTVWISAEETYNWANRPGKSWPCSQLSGKSLVASFDDNGLYDYAINGKCSYDLCGDEFSACIADHLAEKLPTEHPAYFAAVGQFIPYKD